LLTMLRHRALIALALLAAACSPPEPSTSPSPSPSPSSPPPAAERATANRPDDVSGYQIHAMYVLPIDGDDSELDVGGSIETSVMAFNNWLAQQSGGARLRLDTYNGRLDVTFLRLEASDDALAAAGAYLLNVLQHELKAHGFDDPHKLYAVYYGGRSEWACGYGSWPPSMPGTLAVRAIGPGSYHRDPGTPCWTGDQLTPSVDDPRYLEFGMLHETLHSMGFVADCAPSHALAGHTADGPQDLMYSGPETWQPAALDLGRDDYFQHGNPDCPDLARSAFLEPLPQGAQPPAGWQQSVTHKGTSLRDIRHYLDHALTVVNNGNRSLQVFRVVEGAERLATGVHAGDRKVLLQPDEGATWQVRDEHSAEVLLEFSSDGEAQLVEIP